MAAAEDVSFGRVPAGDGDRFCSGRLTLTAMATPGHTPGHLSYVLRADEGAPAAVFTGGSMLLRRRRTYRPDRPGSDRRR